MLHTVLHPNCSLLENGCGVILNRCLVSDRALCGSIIQVGGKSLTMNSLFQFVWMMKPFCNRLASCNLSFHVISFTVALDLFKIIF